jgi:hypothetical protein
LITTISPKPYRHSTTMSASEKTVPTTPVWDTPKIIHFIRIFHSKIHPKSKSPPAPGFFRAWRRLGIDHAPQELPRGRAQHVVRAEQGMGCQEMMTLEQRLRETTRGHTLEGI